MEIYIKPKKKVEIVEKNFIILKDIADVYGPKDIQKKIQNTKVIITDNQDKAYLVSVIDIINILSSTFTGYSIVNVGEMDTLVYYKNRAPNKGKIKNWLKVVFICAILFVGSSTAIMAFHTDSQIGQVFTQYHRIFFGEEEKNPYIINIPYSIGLALGIVIFFNHFNKKKFTKEPTPIEVEMTVYEQEVEDTVIKTLSKNKVKL